MAAPRHLPFVRERIRDTGADYLSNTDMLTALIGATPDDGVALIERFGSFSNVARATVAELRAAGLTETRAMTLAAAAAFGRRAAVAAIGEYPAIRAPEDVDHLMRPLIAHQVRETLYVLLLDTKHQVRQSIELYRGTVDAASVRVAEILAPAVKLGVPNIIIVHNHPSGDPCPSPADAAVTRRVRTSGELLDVELLDHIVIGARGFVSMKQRGLGFSS
ncbi:MAG: DNA repair protein RadC [Spirochaetaceae bacterium]|nr:DNA repair protein RadC [Spirochaetaceae bacterium]